MSQIVWKQITRRFEVYKGAYLGPIEVGQVGWNALRSKTDVNKEYKYSCFLPKLRNSSGEVATEEEGKERVEKLIRIWLKAAGLTFVETGE